MEKKSDGSSGQASKKQKTLESELTSRSSQNPDYNHYQDTVFVDNHSSYCSFSTSKTQNSISTSTMNTEPKQLNSIQQLVQQASSVSSNEEADKEDEQQQKIVAAKKLLFPSSVASSFTEVADELRNERRQEFCPIYQDETPEQIALRRKKQRPVGSLLAKRIRWDDLKRKREEDEKTAQMHFDYYSYGPKYTSSQSTHSFTNPYEHYYETVQRQHEQMMQMNYALQEHSGFWPEFNRNPFPQNTDPRAHYTYTSMYSDNAMSMNMNTSNFPPSSYAAPVGYNSLLNNTMQPPPPPNDPYPY